MTRSHRTPRKARTPRVAIFVALLVSTAFLVGGSSSGNHQNSAPLAAKAPQAKGVFKSLYVPVKNHDYAAIEAMMKKGKVLEELSSDLTKTIALPADITLSFDECGEVNAFYDPEKRQVHMCYELLEHFNEAFEPDAKNEAELDAAVEGAATFVFFHELGHALVHVLDLPVTGKEEDAVDQLSTLLLADGSDEGEQSVLTAARWFLLEHQQNDTDIEKLAFWDEHSLEAQRFYNIVCWLYGHDEKRYAGLVKTGLLPEERAARCAGEFQQLEKSWSRLLEPHLKK
jgi:Putative metallopeptidase